jgi:hypothetical protein
MPWTDRVQIAAPADLKQEANRLAYLIDPDVGGDQTFEGEATHSIDGTAPATHIVANTQLQQDTFDLLTTSGPLEIMDHIQTLAAERGREMPSWSASKIETVIAKIEVGSEYEQVEEPLDETLD